MTPPSDNTSGAPSRFSLVTNASLADDVRIRHTVPNWLRTFGDRVLEIVIVVDPQRPSGRIAALHGSESSLLDLEREIEKLSALDTRVRAVRLPDPATLGPLAARWFRSGRPVRCQAGTPIIAFVFAFECAASDLVLRADCDMLFTERGWLEEALALVRSGSPLLIEPPRLGLRPGDEVAVSTRALVVSLTALRGSLLPMRPHRLGPLRRLTRWVRGHPSWLALEQMLDVERAEGHVKHLILPDSLGYSLHVATRSAAGRSDFHEIVQAIERDELAGVQRSSWNFLPDEWAGGAQ